MDRTGWKITAIIFIVLFVGFLTFAIWAWSVGINEIEQQNECYYDICNEYPDAWIDGDICFCYEYSLLGESVVAKTTYMRD